MLGLPKDPMMLFSVINAHLRDTYPSLDALCDDLHVEKQQPKIRKQSQWQSQLQ